MGINVAALEKASDFYSNCRPSLLQRVKDFVRSDLPLNTGMVVAAAGVVGAVAAACYGSHMELNVLQEHGKAALDAYREANHFAAQDFDSLATFAKAAVTGTITPAKAMAIGFMGAATALVSSAAVKAASMFAGPPPTKIDVMHKFDHAFEFGKLTGLNNVGEKVEHLASLSVLDRREATKEHPALRKIVSMMEDLKNSDPEAANGILNYMDKRTAAPEVKVNASTSGPKFG